MEEEVLRIFVEKNIFPKVVRMEVMVGVADMSLFAETNNFGLYFTLSFKNTSRRDTVPMGLET
jgi:hypothetical protein